MSFFSSLIKCHQSLKSCVTYAWINTLGQDDVKIEKIPSLWYLQAMLPDQGLLLPERGEFFFINDSLIGILWVNIDLLHPPTMIPKLSSCLSTKISFSLLKQAFPVVLIFLTPCWPISSGFDFTQKSFGVGHYHDLS